MWFLILWHFRLRVVFYFQPWKLCWNLLFIQVSLQLGYGNHKLRVTVLENKLGWSLFKVLDDVPGSGVFCKHYSPLQSFMRVIPKMWSWALVTGIGSPMLLPGPTKKACPKIKRESASLVSILKVNDNNKKNRSSW